MQTFKVTVTNNLTNESRTIDVLESGPELAHKTAYFEHLDAKELIDRIMDEDGVVLYTDENGFATQPMEIPSMSDRPEGVPSIEPPSQGFERNSEKVNY